MNLLPDEQQLAITDMVRGFLGEQLPVRRYQDADNRGAPYPAPLWSQLVGLGWFGIGVGEADGGMGLGLADEMLLAREGGRQLVSPTVLGTSLAIHLLAGAGGNGSLRIGGDGERPNEFGPTGGRGGERPNEFGPTGGWGGERPNEFGPTGGRGGERPNEFGPTGGRGGERPNEFGPEGSGRAEFIRPKKDLCGELIAGKARVALALATNVQINGGKVSAGLSIFDGRDALYVLACDQHSCFLVDANTIEAQAMAACTDESLAMAQATLSATAVVAVSTDPAMRRIFALFLAAALTGIAEAARDDAAGYAIEREQFGQAIGSFQAINHLCADMAVLAEASWAQCAYAALALEHNVADAAQAVASAAVVAERAALDNARNNIQIHGGVGFTVEYDAHYYAKRSHVYRQLGRACLSTLDELVPR